MYITFDEIMSYKMKVEGLQADNKRLNDKDGLYDEVKELQAENKALDEQVSDLMIDKDKLKAENKRIRNTLVGNASMYDGLKADNVRLVKQVGTLSHSNSTHTIAKELDEYLENNATCKGVKLFILPCEEFDEDCEYNGGAIYWDDGME